MLKQIKANQSKRDFNQHFIEALARSNVIPFSIVLFRSNLTVNYSVFRNFFFGMLLFFTGLNDMSECCGGLRK